MDPCDSAKTNTPVLQHWGVLFLFLKRQELIPQAGYRLLIAIQPFDDVMANYTTHDGDNKRNYELHVIHLLSVTRFGGGNIKIIAWFFVTCYDLCKETFELLFRFINAYILPESGMHFEPQRWLPE